MKRALVIGAGPAGLMAAEVLAERGCAVTIADQMPSPARKFLMAGKSGLNLTKAEDAAGFLQAYGATSPQFAQAVTAFGPTEVQNWAAALGQEIFTGSTGRVFPRAMKSSPLLRAWLARLERRGVTLHRRWKWAGFEGGDALFETPDGPMTLASDVTVLAMGGGSWRRLGSDGAWAGHLPNLVAPFAPSNVGLQVAWSSYMTQHFGAAIKSVAWRAGTLHSRGEAVVTAKGLEGGGVYTLSPALRDGAALEVDLVPDLSPEDVTRKLAARRAGKTVSQTLKSAFRISGAKAALFHEWAKAAGLRDPLTQIKSLPVPYAGLMDIDGAISTAGGLRWDALDGWMIRDKPGVFAAGEMLDWDAPTGGYLITGCLATGRAAGQAAAKWITGAPA